MYSEEVSISSFRGRDNFFDFYKDETGGEKKSKYMGTVKPNLQYRPDQPHFSYLPQTEKEVKDLMSSNLTLRTFDVRHMDHFLRTSEWGKTPPNQLLTMSSVLQQTPKISLDKNARTRISNDPNRIDFKSNYSLTNPLVRLSNQSQKLEPEKLYQTFFEFPTQKITTDKLQIGGEKLLALKSSGAQKSEVNDLRKTREEYHAWKNEHLLRKKRFRILKGQFKSGILHGDDPFIEDTKLYKEDFKEMQRIKEKMADPALALQHKPLNKNFIANPVIDADNIFYRIKTANPDNGPSENQFRRTIPLWKSKGRVPEAECQEKYIDRLFSPPPIGSNRSKARELAIKRNQNRGRDFDIITKEYLKDN